ncbi:acyl-CoA dehydrogenase domain-containing protein [Streptomyces bingchenggensis BCW-1]|uniref:Acyl-CoA dehydrogenase domain-containing protein n=1 Tax=Streptomyces bingchenggensis (strain BCW-1) TaxID=749414 RepID=D7BUV8_STRBB|nr:acyl-CoA dehydrogenase domain-containing protein [Streptomyces bingchenggensis BCW-1]
MLQEEAARALVTLGTVRTQLDVVLPYFLAYADTEQRERWYPGLASGELLTAIAMTEPGTGSDIEGIRTTAVRDGDAYVLNGAKTFITGGLLADLVTVVARTSTDPGDRRAGLTLMEDGMPGSAGPYPRRCLQLCGGYRYMLEYPIARLYADARITHFHAGTSEVMKVIIAKSLGL